MYEFFVRNVAPKINDLDTKINILAIGPDDVSDHESPFYHPEIHNEIRMGFSHLARHEVVSGSIQPGEVIENSDRTNTLTLAVSAIASAQQQVTSNNTNFSKEEEKANSHIQRANMDADKLRYLDLVHEEEQFEKKHNMRILADLDGGSFYRNLTDRQNQARLAFEDAKVLEALGFHDKASEKYLEAGDLMEDAFEYLVEMKGPIAKAKKDFRWSTATLILVVLVDIAVFTAPFFIGR